jgi:hypothetical protein
MIIQLSSTALAIFVFYLALTGWVAIKRGEGQVGLFEIGALVAPVGICFGALALAFQGAGSPDGAGGDAPYQVAIVLAAFAALLAGLDISVILRGGLAGRQRLARHFGRLCLAVLVTGVSVGIGQAEDIPGSIGGRPFLLAPEIVVAGVAVVWLARAGLTRWFANRRPVRRGLPNRQGLTVG